MVHPAHPVTEPYSLTHLPMASMWVIASTTCFLYLLPPRLLPSEGLRLFFEPNLYMYNTPISQPQSHFIPTRLWRWNRHSVPKLWHLNYRPRGITQKKAYDKLYLDQSVKIKLDGRSRQKNVKIRRGVNSLTPELNPSAQRCLPRFFYWRF
jgi:hypothetical protein